MNFSKVEVVVASSFILVGHVISTSDKPSYNLLLLLGWSTRQSISLVYLITHCMNNKTQVVHKRVRRNTIPNASISLLEYPPIP